jgi:hypothetical protein
MIECSVKTPRRIQSLTLLRVIRLLVYNLNSDSVEDVLRGFNSTIFAYGQTGSGKTYTMFGPHWEDNLGFQNTMGGLGTNMN